MLVSIVFFLFFFMNFFFCQNFSINFIFYLVALFEFYSVTNFTNFTDFTRLLNFKLGKENLKKESMTSEIVKWPCSKGTLVHNEEN